MSTYLLPIFTNNIQQSDIKTIFELGSRDLIDAYTIQDNYKCKVYAFECNPDCIGLCNETVNRLGPNPNVKLITKAVSLENKEITFYPFDLTKYDNMGASSLLIKDFSKHNVYDPDYNRPNPQKEITVDGIRLDTFCEINNISNVDMLCIDLQGYELNALKSMGSYLDSVKYIITELSIDPTYKDGSSALDVIKYLADRGFTYVSSTRYNYNMPDFNAKGFSEFDALFVRM
jgi:FkbM family methyltransferase